MNTTYLLSQDEILLNLSKITEDLKKMQIENQILRISQKKLEQKMNYTDNIIKLITGYNKVKDDSYIINTCDEFYELDDDIDSYSSMPSLIEVDDDDSVCSDSSMPSLIEVDDYTLLEVDTTNS